MATSLGIDIGISRLLFDLAFAKPGSRKQESEADYIGLMMMANGCFRPEAAIELWHRMEEEEGSSRPEFLSTHPSNVNRAKNLQTWLPEAIDKFNASDCSLTMGYIKYFSEFAEDVDWI